MTRNDILRSIRYLMNIHETKLIEIIEMSGCQVTPEEITTYLKREDEEGFKEISQRVMAHFLNGLVIYKRGRDESKPPQPLEMPVTNNVVLKKLRVAFELRDTDILEMMEKSGIKISKTELSSFFRKQGHRNYRDCGDQFLRNLLKGMAA